MEILTFSSSLFSSKTFAASTSAYKQGQNRVGFIRSPPRKTCWSISVIHAAPQLSQLLNIEQQLFPPLGIMEEIHLSATSTQACSSRSRRDFHSNGEQKGSNDRPSTESHRVCLNLHFPETFKYKRKSKYGTLIQHNTKQILCL